MELSIIELSLIVFSIYLIVFVVILLISNRGLKEEVETVRKSWKKDFEALQNSRNEDLKRLEEERHINSDKLGRLKIMDMKNAEKISQLTETLNKKTKSEASLQRKIEVLAEENRYLIENGPNILKVQAKKQQFDDIVDGIEKTLTLESNTYWENRLLSPAGDLKEYHAVVISNGRKKGCPSSKFIVEYIDINVSEGKKYFVVNLGDKLS